MIDEFVPDNGARFSLHQNGQTVSGAHPVFRSMETGVSFPWGKTAEQ
jgi:hypothetical protein